MMTTHSGRLHLILFAMGCSALASCKEMLPDTTAARVVVMEGATPRLTATLVSGASATYTTLVTNAGGGTLPIHSVTWASSDQGVATVSQSGVVTGVRSGQASITANVGDLVSPALVVTVTPGAAAKLAVRTQPAGAAAALPLSSQPVIEVQDAAGNLVSSNVVVTATIATGQGTITNSTATATAGVAAFSGLTLTGLVGDRTLTFSAPGLASVTSSGLALNPGVASQLVIRAQPLGAISGLPLLGQPVVDIRDVAGNVVTGFAGTVIATVATGSGTLLGATVNAAGGVATFTKLAVAGPPTTLSLSFTTFGIPTVTSQSFTVAASALGLRRR